MPLDVFTKRRLEIELHDAQFGARLSQQCGWVVGGCIGLAIVLMSPSAIWWPLAIPCAIVGYKLTVWSAFFDLRCIEFALQSHLGSPSRAAG